MLSALVQASFDERSAILTSFSGTQTTVMLKEYEESNDSFNFYRYFYFSLSRKTFNESTIYRLIAYRKKAHFGSIIILLPVLYNKNMYIMNMIEYVYYVMYMHRCISRYASCRDFSLDKAKKIAHNNTYNKQ